MNPAPQPDVPGTTEFQRFDAIFRKVITVPKSAIAKREEKPPQPQKRSAKRKP